jgi:hypothetical protein
MAQTGTSFQYSVDGGGNNIDMAFLELNTSGAADFTFSQSTDVPILGRSLYSYKVATVTQQATVSATDRARVGWKVEGVNLPQMLYGSANAIPLVLSFWAKSTDTGDHAFHIGHLGTTAYYVSTITINAADTWEFKTVVIDGDTANAINQDNTLALFVSYCPMAGADFQAAALNTWYAGSAARSYAGTVNLFANASGEFYVSDMKLEPGVTPTSYIPRDFRDLQDSCYRYCKRFKVDNTLSFMASGRWHATTYIYLVIPIDMRDTPELEDYDASSMYVYTSTGGIAVTDISFSNSRSSRQMATIAASVASGGLTGDYGILFTNGSTDTFFTLSSRI